MTTDGSSGEGDGAAADEAAAEREAALAATIWTEVDRALSGVSVEPEPGALDLIVHIPKDEVIRGLRALKDDETLRFDYLRSLTAVDNEGDGIDIVYHLYSIEHRYNLTVKATLPNDDLSIGTATAVWKAANWLERETAEMFGVRFDGHPDPRTLLLPEDMTDSFPLRKDHPLAEIEVLQGEGIAYPREQDA
ncbi:MAG: NADH-quinone oxidoreductase subunit C [Chloroflexi bacterium]|nr:NADH-quinone oxidoreductase subunit C [Chloroflexota bacterium]